MADKNIVFTAAIRGFHVYKSTWKPEQGEILNCHHEEDNPYDIFSIKVCKSGNDTLIVGHLPMEISRITKFILQRGARVTAKVTGKHYRRSPLVQGGLEVPCQINIRMSGSIVNHTILSRYQNLVEELYLEPTDEEIIGTFLSVGQIHEEPTEKNTQKNKTGTTTATVRSRDIRAMLSVTTRDVPTQQLNDTIIID